MITSLFFERLTRASETASGLVSEGGLTQDPTGDCFPGHLNDVLGNSADLGSVSPPSGIPLSSELTVVAGSDDAQTGG
jgi:hypothetical protein